jgi:hypothetical protein
MGIKFSNEWWGDGITSDLNGAQLYPVRYRVIVPA